VYLRRFRRSSAFAAIQVRDVRQRVAVEVVPVPSSRATSGASVAVAASARSSSWSARWRRSTATALCWLDVARSSSWLPIAAARRPRRLDADGGARVAAPPSGSQYEVTLAVDAQARDSTQIANFSRKWRRPLRSD
jgi:hypothetical protein